MLSCRRLSSCWELNERFSPENKTSGRFTWKSFAETFILFVVELVWECFRSWVVLRFNTKINNTRTLGNLLKVPKYFAADFLPFYTSSGLSLVTSLAVNQTLFCLIFYRKMGEKFAFALTCSSRWIAWAHSFSKSPKTLCDSVFIFPSHSLS